MQKNKFVDSVKQYLRVALLEIIIIVAVIIVDLATKFIFSRVLAEDESLTLIPKFLHFTYTKNYAAAFSFDFGLGKILGEAGVRIFFIIITFLALGLFFFMLISAKGKNKLNRISLSLIIGGAIGNLYDRIFYGFVRDFIDIEYFGAKLFGSYHFAIFNIADSALVIGVILLAVYYIFIYKEPQKVVAENDSSDSYNGLSQTPVCIEEDKKDCVSPVVESEDTLQNSGEEN